MCVCRELSSALSSLKRVRCLCLFPSASFFHKALSELSRHLKECPSSEEDLKTYRCCYLTTTTFIRTLIVSVTNSDLSSLCWIVQDCSITLKRIKIELAVLIYRILNRSTDRFVIHASKKLIFHLLFSVPCTSSLCESTCKSVLHGIFRGGEENGLATVIKLFIPLVTDSESNEDSSFASLMKTEVDPCRRRLRIQPNTTPDLHQKSSVKFLSQFLAGNWKTIVCSSYLEDSAEMKDADKLSFLSLWIKMTQLHYSTCYPGLKNFVSSISFLLDRVRRIEQFLIWRKELEIVNAALCYGSTLGLQNEIPPDIFSISQKLIRLSKSADYYSSIVLPEIRSGLAGDRVISRCLKDGNKDEKDDEDAVTTTMMSQSLILIHLKAIAIVVREAQCCSSSEESDASSGTESSVLNEDIVIIERSITDILESMTSWMRSTFHFHPRASFISMFMKISREQDDAMIEGLLCMLDIFVGLKLTTQTLDPVIAFNELIESISLDHSLLLDFLLSNETCFLLYFLRFLKYLTRSSRILTHDYSNVILVLKNIEKAIEKLTDKSLFPYDISPVHNLLKQISK